MRSLVLALMFPCTTLSTWAQAQAPIEAIQAVADYSRALQAADCNGMLDLSAVMHRHPETQKDICASVIEMKRMGMLERLRQPTSSVSSGRYRMVVIPNSRIIVSGTGPMIANGVYVAVSSDSGHGWQVIDIACQHLPEWVKGLYPPYDGHPSFDVATVDNPTSR